MGEPSQEQIDETIDLGIASGWSDKRILDQLMTLERWSDEELAAIGIFPPPPKDDSLSPSPSPSPARLVSPSRGHAPHAAQRPRPRGTLASG